MVNSMDYARDEPFSRNLTPYTKKNAPASFLLTTIITAERIRKISRRFKILLELATTIIENKTYKLQKLVYDRLNDSV